MILSQRTDGATLKRAVIVGATGGIGQATARALAPTHDLTLVGRDPAKLTELYRSLPSGPLGHDTWTVDLEAYDEAYDMAPHYDEVDVLVLAAGAWSAGPIGAGRGTHTFRDELACTIAINFTGQVEIVRALLPALRAARGHVVVINSTAVLGSPRGRSIYTASKAALSAFTLALHDEEFTRGVRVTSLLVGRTATDMQREVRASEGQTYEPDHYLAPEDVAGVIRSVIDMPPSVEVGELIVRSMPKVGE